jgi:hypothetical protein
MIGLKHLELDEETMVQIVNEYVTRNMPRLGVCVSVQPRTEGRFRIELAERQEDPPSLLTPTLPDAPPAPGEPVVRLMRQEGVK